MADTPHGLILYDHPNSPCARRVRITLVEKDLAWATQIIDLSRLEQRRPEYLALNPNGVVPTLAHGTRVIYESNVITAYLDDQFPAVALYPIDPDDLAAVHAWQAAELAMAKDYRPLMYQRLLGPLLRLTRTLDEALAAARRSTSDAADLAWEEKVWNLAVLTPPAEAAAEARLWAWLDRLEGHLDGRTFLVGERCTQAEVSVYPRVMMYAFVQLPITAARHPRVAAWMARLRERPSFATTLSDADRQLLALAQRPLLPWLGRTLQKNRPSLLDRLKLGIARRMARRALGEARIGRDQTAEKTRALLKPRTGDVAPADMPARRGDPATAAERAAALILYDHPLSPHGRRVRIVLREKGLAWTTLEVDLLRMAHKAPDYLAVNPAGELPALRHGERIVVDTPAIAAYLERVFPAVPLAPDQAWPLAQMRMWLALEAGTHKEFRPLWWLCVARPALADALAPGVAETHAQWWRDVAAGQPRFDTSPELARRIVTQKLAVLEGRLARHEYLVGEALSMADIAWFTRVELLPQLGVEVTHPGIRRWSARLAARPAFAAA